MKILAIDTSTKYLCIGVFCDGKVHEYNLETGRELSRLIAVTIDRVLKAVGLEPADIGYFACGLGPGSFTGMRVGVSFIKGLAWVNKKKVIGISTLDILAKGIKSANQDIVPVIDAKRNLFYSCIFSNANGRLRRKTPYLLLNQQELLKKIKPQSIILGDGVPLLGNHIFGAIRGAEILDKDYWYPKAHNIIELALEKIKNKSFNSAFDIKPIYLYPKECQIRNV
ncbi:MAG: tRNA (adenosine(37)-N6)-threonylcarbamoyltransferase complex dimerization subunit type 1 TsaB [Candidatus Omnitrophica bacterium]|nr:tRNA (adenosine(37)-N6)-threonylcarbamoyltransferase complex dimerization subunit type 1 TsaB [Candidatus Omnitrophota bacterium]